MSYLECDHPCLAIGVVQVHTEAKPRQWRSVFDDIVVGQWGRRVERLLDGNLIFMSGLRVSSRLHRLWITAPFFRMSVDVLEIDGGLTQRIAMARVICILCMIYVHVPSALPAFHNHSLQTDDIAVSFQGFVIEGLGRASAALLSVVSGYLMAVVLSRPGLSLPALYRRRFQSLMVPMLVWSFITLLVYLLGNLLSTVWAYLNFFLFLTELPMGPTMHLAFLRDLFVCILIGPVLAMLVRHAALPLLLFVAWLYLADLETVFMLRPLVLFGYVIGLTLAICNADMSARLSA